MNKLKQLEPKLRSTVGLAALSAMSILFVAQNLSNISHQVAYIIGAGVVGLILFFALKK